MGNRHFEPLYERYGAVRSARNRQRHHEPSQGRYPRCERDKADFDGFATVIRKYMGIPELTPRDCGRVREKDHCSANKMDGRRRRKIRIVWSFVGERKQYEDARIPPRQRKSRAAWQRPCCPARYFPLWVCRLCAALSKSVRRGIRSLFFCGREQGARARRRELPSLIKSPCWQVRKGSCRRSGR